MCLASHNNHPTSLASSWDISFLKSLVQQDPKGSNKVAHLFILDVYVSPSRKYVSLSLIYYILDFSFFMSQDDAYFHIHQNDPSARHHSHPPDLFILRWWYYRFLLLRFMKLLMRLEVKQKKKIFLCYRLASQEKFWRSSVFFWDSET